MTSDRLNNIKSKLDGGMAQVVLSIDSLEQELTIFAKMDPDAPELAEALDKVEQAAHNLNSIVGEVKTELKKTF